MKRRTLFKALLIAALTPVGILKELVNVEDKVFPTHFASIEEIQDIERFQQLPFYFVKNEVKNIPNWKSFGELYGKVELIP